MSQALDNLLSLLQLEKIEEGFFRGQSQDLGLPQVFGGQVVAQALYAAKQTVAEDRFTHSLHSYFLRPGDSKKPIAYSVEVLRDGQSVSARRVSALQNGKPIFSMTASFQIVENGLEHQSVMPLVALPDAVPSTVEVIQKMLPFLPEKMQAIFSQTLPLEIRPITFRHPLKGQISQPLHHAWLRANGNVPDDLSLHQYILGYASDLTFLPTALQPHGKGFLEADIQIATLDHAIWFHRPFDINQWLLYCMDSPSASGARGFVRGQLYNQQGVLVASTAQEGIIRQRK